MVEQEDAYGGNQVRRVLAHQNPANRLGEGLYVVSYALQGVWRHKRRSATVLLGMLIGIALVTSVFVWTDTGARVAIDDFFYNRAYHYYLRPSSQVAEHDPRAIYPIMDWLADQPSTQTFQLIYWSIGFIEIDEQNSTDPYMPWPVSHGVKDCSIFLVNNTFLQRASSSFVHSGEFRVTPTTILVSQEVVDDARELLGIELGIGSFINLAIATNNPLRNYPSYYFDPHTIGDFEPLFFENLQIVGIYDTKPKDEVLYYTFPTQQRQNIAFAAQETVFGWFDGIIISKDLLTEDECDKIALFVEIPNLLVEVNHWIFLAQGINTIGPSLERFFTQLESENPVWVGGRTTLRALDHYILAYNQRQIMILLLVPGIILSILLTIFSTNFFLSGRRREIALLRSRGANYGQLFATLFVEVLFLASFATFFGNFFGILIGCLLPAATGFLFFDYSVFIRFLGVVQVSPILCFGGVLVCLVPSIFYAIIAIRSFLRQEILSAIRSRLERSLFNLKRFILYLLGLILFSVIFLYSVLTIPFGAGLSSSLFIVGVILWLALCYVSIHFIGQSIAGLSFVLHPLVGQMRVLIAKSARTSCRRILFLLLILSLTFSLTIFTLVEAQTYQNNVNRQIEYYMGSDLRVFTTPSPITAVDELHAISGVNKATSIIEVAAKIGSIEIHLFGIDPITYLSIGKWQSTSTIGADSHTIFSALASNPDAVVLPHHLANQFNMHSGSHLNITVYDQHDLFLEEKTFEVVGEFLSAPGFGYANPSDPLASTSPISGFGFQVNHVYAFCHIDYFLVEIPSWKSNPYVNLTQLIFANLTPATNHTDIVNAVQELNFVRVVWTPQTFNLKEIDFEAALFLQGVISLLSVSFYAALVISSIALTVFVSAVVRERQIEYAIMRALGGTRRQVTLIIVGEFAGMVLGAFLLGIILGFVFSWLSMFALLKWFPIPFILPFILEYSNPMLFTVLGLVVTCMLAGIYLPARRSGALQIRTILRTL